MVYDTCKKVEGSSSRTEKVAGIQQIAQNCIIMSYKASVQKMKMKKGNWIKPDWVEYSESDKMGISSMPFSLLGYKMCTLA